VLSATGITEGSFLPSGGSTFLIPGMIDNNAGIIAFNADTLLSAISGVSGSGTLIEFDFTALAHGTSTLTIGNEILQDSTGAILTDTTTPGGRDSRRSAGTVCAFLSDAIGGIGRGQRASRTDGDGIFGTSCERWSEFMTDFFGSFPIRQVPSK
jgi:hypothetical protein